jgi:KRAB domain-containing zinc finger protein
MKPLDASVPVKFMKGLTLVKNYKNLSSVRVSISSSFFQRHRQVHNGEKFYVCKQCGKALTHSVSLQRHEIMHAGKN